MEATGWRTGLMILDSKPIQNEVFQRSPLLRRVSRNTPFWRMVIGSKPIQAYCQHHYECITKSCRDGHCTHSKFVS
ncbi:liver-expressed antimicrobial peptide 2 isoform X2 [Carcharodon carcharias]|uniref:liver-expressed antimicrobial peptide 2 isoform X2 n=1 Tax=Carcharodon carcharias TaxID=13397 RepID=UPI001B7E55FD|nr:liver-expressed antimicrobial peptide 2 isoform X2 [Carcharodon carcharias]